MGTPGHRFERQPGERRSRGIDDGVIGDGMARALLAVPCYPHYRFLFALFLGQEGGDAALARLRHAGYQRPVDLARRARAEGFGERGRGEPRFRDQETAGGVLIEPMHEPRALPARVPHYLEHAVDMPRGAGAALHRKAHRFVEHQHISVLVKRDRFEEFQRLVSRAENARRRRNSQRRDAHGLSRFKPVIGIDASAVDAHLALADGALNAGEAQVRNAGLQKAVDAHAGFIFGHVDVLNAAMRAPLPLRSGAKRWGGVSGGGELFRKCTAHPGSLRSPTLPSTRSVHVRRESMPRPGELLAAAGLARSATASAHASSPCRTLNIQPSLPEISGSSNDGNKAGLFDKRIIAAALISASMASIESGILSSYRALKNSSVSTAVAK